MRARDAATDAGDTLSRLAKPSSMVTGRMICLISANGAPDCKLGADKLCQSKGFKEGKSLRHRFCGNVLCESMDSRPGAKAGRLPDRQLRYPRAVPVMKDNWPVQRVVASLA